MSTYKNGLQTKKQLIERTYDALLSNRISDLKIRELAKQGLCVVVITHDGEFLRESGAQTAEWVPKEQLQ